MQGQPSLVNLLASGLASGLAQQMAGEARGTKESRRRRRSSSSEDRGGKVEKDAGANALYDAIPADIACAACVSFMIL